MSKLRESLNELGPDERAMMADKIKAGRNAAREEAGKPDFGKDFNTAFALLDKLYGYLIDNDAPSGKPLYVEHNIQSTMKTFRDSLSRLKTVRQGIMMSKAIK